MQPQYVPFFVFEHKNQYVGGSMSLVCDYCLYEKSMIECDFSNLMIFCFASLGKYIICSLSLSLCVLMFIYFGQGGAKKKVEVKPLAATTETRTRVFEYRHEKLTTLWDANDNTRKGLFLVYARKNLHMLGTPRRVLEIIYWNGCKMNCCG